MERKKGSGVEAHAVGYKTYVYVWIALMALFALTVYVAVAGVAGFSTMINLLIASVKAALVLLFFMHLKYEGKFLKWTLFLTILALTAIIMLTYADTWYRQLPGKGGGASDVRSAPGGPHPGHHLDQLRFRLIGSWNLKWR